MMKKSELRELIREEIREYLIEEEEVSESPEEMTSGDPEQMAREMVGDGNLPNKYWVYKDTQWYTNKDQDAEESNVFDWSGEVYEDVPDKSEFIGMFDTFEEAVHAAKGEYLPSPEDDWDDFHNVYIEDRLSGTIFQGVWYEYVQTHDTRFKKGTFSEFEFEWSDDSKYTKEEMERRGETFE
jgi:hypothetical protein